MQATEQNIRENRFFYQDTLCDLIQKKGLQYVINKIHPHALEPILDAHDACISSYAKALDIAAELLGGMKRAVLTGGLGVEATILARHPQTSPSFHRMHYDLDIGVGRSQFSELVWRAHSYSYYPFSQVCMWHLINNRGEKIGKKDIYCPLSWSDVCAISQGKRLPKVFKLRRKDRNLRLIHIQNGTGEIPPHSDITDYIDVYLHYYEGGKLASNEHGRVNCPRYFNGEQFQTNTGQNLSVVNINYLLLIKQRKAKSRHREKHVFDLELLKKLAA